MRNRRGSAGVWYRRMGLVVLIGCAWLAVAASLHSADAAAPTPARVSVVLQLHAPPVAEFYAALRQEDRTSAAAVAASTQAHLALIEQAQQALLADLAGLDVQLLYRTQRVYNGVAVRVPVEQLAQLLLLPGVTAVHPLVAKQPANQVAAPAIGAATAWQAEGGPGLTGAGVTIAVIDTGVDYLHRTFGGPGTGYDANDPTQVGDVPGFPAPKIPIGYDFVGDSYNADATSPTFQPVPQPDPDPMDCYGFGHGTHVGGSAAGYGVTGAGDTYRGSYPPAPSAQLRLGPGVAPEATIYALKVFGCQGSSELVDAAIEWAVDPNGDGDLGDRVDVINLSLGSNFGALDDPTGVAAENAAKTGVIVVASMGNVGNLFYGASAPGAADRVIAVAASTLPSGETGEPESIALFSARGPRRGDAGLKPDLAAPGLQILSARRGPGDQGLAANGTSMAAGLASGAMALLRQAHPAAPLRGPGWTVEELKALAMNTSVPLFAPSGGGYGPMRAGAGRIDVARALASQVIAYSTAAPGRVGVSFGAPELLEDAQVPASIRVANKGSVPVTLTVAYTTTTDLPGVTIQVESGRVITVPEGGFATLPLTMTAQVAGMRHTRDANLPDGDEEVGSWLGEESGYVLLTPVGGPALRVPVYAAPRPVSDLQVTPAALDFGTMAAATATLTVTGVPLADGAVVTTTTPPTAPVALAGLFALHHHSPPTRRAPDGSDAGDRYAHADLKAVGWAGPFASAETPATLYFLVSTYGPWSTPHEVTFHLDFDLDGDGIPELRLADSDRVGWRTGGPATDAFASVLIDLRTDKLSVQGPLNGLSAGDVDPRLLNGDVMVLPVRQADLGLAVGVKRIRYRVESYSEDVGNATALGLAVDRTPWLTFDLSQPAVQFEPGEQLWTAVKPGSPLPLAYRQAQFAGAGATGLITVFLHNAVGRRVQIVPVHFAWPYQHYFPLVRSDAE